MEKQSVKIRAPRGYKFKIVKELNWDDKTYSYVKSKKPNNISVMLIESESGRTVGNIDLERFRDRYVTHSDLDYTLHNKGIGIILYAKAIQYCHKNGLKVSSSGYSSEAAKRLWQSKRLRNWFRIVRRDKTRRWSAGVDPTWFVYPKKK